MNQKRKLEISKQLLLKILHRCGGIIKQIKAPTENGGCKPNLEILFVLEKKVSESRFCVKSEDLDKNDIVSDRVTKKTELRIVGIFLESWISRKNARKHASQ